MVVEGEDAEDAEDIEDITDNDTDTENESRGHPFDNVRPRAAEKPPGGRVVGA